MSRAEFIFWYVLAFLILLRGTAYMLCWLMCF